jgi:type I restriction enzyme S subunit
MKRYDTYKDSGIEWIGEIPGHWGVRKFNYLFSFSRGLSITKQDLKDEGVPCVNYGEIHSKFGFEVNPEKNRLKCVENEYLETSEKSLLNRGDFIFADTSEDIEGSGNFTHLHSDIPTFAGYHTIIAKQKESKNYRYLAYFFDSLHYRNQIRSEVSGIKVFSITQAILKNSSVVIPTPSEQTAIAHYLDRKTAEIDALIADKKRLLELYEEEKTVIINQAVTKGLDPDAPMKDSGIEWLGEVPAHWMITRINRVIKVKDGTHDTPSYLPISNKNFPLITSKDFKNGDIDFENAKYISEEDHEKIVKRSNTEKGDILMSMIGGNIGNLVLVKTSNPFSIKNVCLFKTSHNAWVAKHLYYILKSDLLKIQIDLNSRGGAQGFLSLDDLRSLIYFVLPEEEMKLIVSHLETYSNQIDLQVSRTQKLINLLTEYRTALISEVVTGKLKVIY